MPRKTLGDTQSLASHPEGVEVTLSDDQALDIFESLPPVKSGITLDQVKQRIEEILVNYTLFSEGAFVKPGEVRESLKRINSTALKLLKLIDQAAVGTQSALVEAAAIAAGYPPRYESEDKTWGWESPVGQRRFRDALEAISWLSFWAKQARERSADSNAKRGPKTFALTYLIIALAPLYEDSTGEPPEQSESDRFRIFVEAVTATITPRPPGDSQIDDAMERAFQARRLSAPAVR